MTHLKEGDAAPNFSGTLSNGKPVSLADYAGKKLVIYFYPKDDTPGCTAEACSLRDGYAELREKGYEILGVSPDGVAKHQKFINKYELPFDLLADEDKSVLQAFGAWGPKKFMGRSYDGVHRFTFVIDEAGNIAKIITKVKTTDHAAQVLDAMAEG
ncbi:MAG: thioredoxin-dependent thiol peroxidase [Bacteroidetes bacterium]|nr:MAG: thioredoxin-dependent thiol peroxidase [Bacteroidota bacterium]PTM08671.1 MAG: thioredoxin-dependent thiol peroxidase [Bacteroidota bacterium]